MLALAALPFEGCIPGSAAGEEMEMPGGFDGILASQGRYFGTAARIDQLERFAALRRATLANCSSITPEVHLKWDALEPERGRLLFEPVDRLLDFADANGLRLHGHTLLWDRSVPSWASAALQEKSPNWRTISFYMDAVLSRYGTRIERWDVVNEPLETSDGGDNLKRNLFYTAFGDGYISRALEEARSRVPSAKLLLNEYSLEYDNEVERDRRRAMLRLLEKLKTSGAPIDGLGIQAHLDLGKGRLLERIIGPFLQEVADMGLEIHISELDVKERDFRPSKATRDQRVADEARRYLEIALAQPAVKGVTTWGLSDRYSWLTPDPSDLEAGHLPSAAALRNRGLPYDERMGEKPLYSVMRDTFEAASLG
jgi:endo-1,4-beta-xylanase